MTSKENSSALGSTVARKSAARLAAVQAVYQMSLNNQTAADVIAEFIDFRIGKSVDGEKMVAADGALFTEIVKGLDAREDDATDFVKKAMETRSIAGKSNIVEPLLESILLCGAYELMANGTTDAPIIISDYVNVAHSFYADGAPQLVNAVLDTINKAIRS
jgi:N utilization substance protein B